MDNQFAIQLFEQKQVRVVWDAEVEKYYFSIVDVVQLLTDSVDGRKYWNKLKQRLKAEGNESVTNCLQLKLPSSDGKKYNKRIIGALQKTHKCAIVNLKSAILPL